MTLQALLTIVIGYCIGVTIETLSDLNYYITVWLLGLAFVVGLLWRQTHTTSPQLYLVPLFLIFVSFGLLRTDLYEAQFDQSLDQLVYTEVELVGTVEREPDRRTNTQLLYIRHEEEIILVTTDRTTVVSYHDVVQISGTLERPENFTTDLGRTFNYQGYLEAKGVEYRISFADVTVVEERNGGIIGWLLSLKQSFMQQLDSVLIEPEGSLADGLLLGLNQGLGDQLEEDFRRSGIIHIVVLSGYNIMLVVAFVMYILSFFLRERLRLMFGLLAIVSFALIVGLSATVVRASIMAALLLVAQTFRRSYDVLRALLLAGLAMLVINPYLLIYDIGFQLSFMATLGLIAALPFFSANDQPEVLTSIKGYLVATIATQIAVLPLLIYHIGEVSIVSVIVNVLVLPMVPLAMFTSFVSALLAYVALPIGLLFGFISSLTLSYIIYVAQLFASLPFATITLPVVSPWLIPGMYGVLVYTYWYVFVRTKHKDILKGWIIEEEK